MKLEHLRQQIDQVDDELVTLFVRRMEIAEQIADYKKEHALPIFVPAREQEKLEAVAVKAGPEMAEYTRNLYMTIFELSRDHQGKHNGKAL